MKRILVIEDDPAIQKGLVAGLNEEHYETLTASDGEKGFLLAKRENVDLILLDIILPKKNGIDICRDLRSAGVTTPILMLTSKKGEADEVLGLKIGADDYVMKPFSMQRLLARIESLLRRSADLRKEIDQYSFGECEIDFRKLEATKRKAGMKLTAKEFDILKYFVQREGEVVTRDMLLSDVWGYGDDAHIPTTRTIDNYILALRKKIEDNPSEPKHLLTVHTAGYKFVR
jgi:DNA-binding response OmpR family regulator